MTVQPDLAQPYEPNQRQRGVSLLEVMIAVSILMIATTGATILVLRSQGLIVEVHQHQAVDEIGMRVVNRMAEELRAIDPTTLQPFVLDGASSCTFREVVSYDENGPVHGPETTLRLEPDDGEKFNGRDDNGDGRIDEAILVWEQKGQRPATLARNLLSLSLDDADHGVTISARVGVLNRAGELISRDYTQRVAFRAN